MANPLMDFSSRPQLAPSPGGPLPLLHKLGNQKSYTDNFFNFLNWSLWLIGRFGST